LEGLKTSLDHQLIDGLIIKIYPTSKPIRIWLELIVYLKHHNYDVFDLASPKNILGDDFMKFNLEQIHQVEEATLLFLKKDLNIT